MTQPIPVPLDEARAGDLIGYTKNGRPIHLPAGGAPRDGEIAVDDGDDEPDDFGGDDGPDEEDELDEEPAPTRRSNKPSYAELKNQLARLQGSVRRNNAELQKRRQVERWMEQHGISDLDTWLGQIGVDKETGQPAAAAPAEPNHEGQPAATEPAPTSPQQPVVDEAEIERRVQLRLEQGEARAQEHNDTLRAALVQARLETELLKLRFRGKVETALRVADLDSIQVEDDGAVVGADEAAKSLMTEIPEWFRGSNGTVRTGGEDVDGGGRRRVPAKPKTWEEQVMQQIRSR